MLRLLLPVFWCLASCLVQVVSVFGDGYRILADLERLHGYFADWLDFVSVWVVVTCVWIRFLSTHPERSARDGDPIVLFEPWVPGLAQRLSSFEARIKGDITAFQFEDGESFLKNCGVAASKVAPHCVLPTVQIGEECCHQSGTFRGSQHCALCFSDSENFPKQQVHLFLIQFRPIVLQ